MPGRIPPHLHGPAHAAEVTAKKIPLKNSPSEHVIIVHSFGIMVLNLFSLLGIMVVN